MLFRSLVDAEATLGKNAYQLSELLSDLKKGIWSELAQKKPVDVYRRNLQKSYITMLNGLLNPSNQSQTVSLPGLTISISSSGDESDVSSVIRAHLVSLKSEVNSAAATIGDSMTKYHLQDISRRIDKALNPKD